MLSVVHVGPLPDANTVLSKAIPEESSGQRNLT